jgi:2-polyprenyl-6-methoxyphenol hydroxylase-like FAD-dependent oxidoreductase
VAIVGGGLAGAMLAIVLGRAGVRVAVAEREARFRDRVRGEALMPWGAALARELGITDALPESGAHPLPIWQTYVDRQPNPPFDWRDDSPTGDGLWGVNHPGLQEALLQRAIAAGAQVFRPAKARRPERDGANRLLLPIETESGTIVVRARLVVGADGRESGVRRWIGAQTVRDPVQHVIGGCLIEGLALDPEASHVGYYPGGMAMIFRQASGRARAYLVASPEDGEAMRGPGAASAIITTCAAALPEGALRAPRAVGPAAFFPGADIFADRLAGDGIVLIGDAAGANDPSQGQGVSLVFKDARELSRLLLTGDDWPAAIEEFARQRPRWYEPLRAYAAWEGPLVVGVGTEADVARAKAERARELDPLLGGYSLIHSAGPDGLPVTEAARGHYLGEGLDEGAEASG